MEQEEGAQNVDYSIEDWKKIWADHNASATRKPRTVSPQLVRFVDQLLPQGPGSVFLPLCGQSPDLRWLYDAGHTVVGLDGVEEAVKSLVQQNEDLKMTLEQTEAGTPLYKSADGRLQLHVCNVLAEHVKTLGPFDAVYDYGSYTAIQERDRQQYLETVMATLKPEYRYLVEFCHDMSKDLTCGPNNISFQTMKKEFGPGKSLKVLETVDISEDWDAQSAFDSFVLVTKKKVD